MASQTRANTISYRKRQRKPMVDSGYLQLYSLPDKSKNYAFLEENGKVTVDIEYLQLFGKRIVVHMSLEIHCRVFISSIKEDRQIVQQYKHFCMVAGNLKLDWQHGKRVTIMCQEHHPLKGANYTHKLARLLFAISRFQCNLVRGSKLFCCY